MPRTLKLPPHEVWGVWEPSEKGVICIALMMAPDEARRLYDELAADGIELSQVVLIDPPPQSPGAILGEAAQPNDAEIVEFDQALATGAATALRSVQAGGFTGEACPMCGQFAMRRTGPCSTCQSCGHNSGCE